MRLQNHINTGIHQNVGCSTTASMEVTIANGLSVYLLGSWRAVNKHSDRGENAANDMRKFVKLVTDALLMLNAANSYVNSKGNACDRA